jgi:hypothetical protein
VIGIIIIIISYYLCKRDGEPMVPS